MTHLCVICSREERLHPDIGFGYLPHPFEPADLVRTDTYIGPERRHAVRRMRDRIGILRHALGEQDHDATATPERRSSDRRAS